MKVSNLLIRSLYYFRNGYGIYLSLPLAMISFATTVYYLLIQNVPALKIIFPGFMEFATILVVVVYPMGVLVGWIHFKKLPFFRVEQDVLTESNPYSQYKLAPIMIPMFQILVELGKKEGLNVSDLEKILKTSV